MIEIIAEIGQAHEGSLGLLHSYIDAVAPTGANTIKFQTHLASAESSREEEFRVNFSSQDKSRYDYWKRMEFTLDQWRGIKKHCEDVGLNFLSSPFSCEAVDLLLSIGLKRFKIGSGDTINYLMLDKILDQKASVILSTGLCTNAELDETVKRIKTRSNPLTILQCTSNYPTSPEQIGLNQIKRLKDRYNVPVGLSDHSGAIYASLAAVSLGATQIEVHVVFDKAMFGPDTSSSITINELSNLVQGSHYIYKVLQNPIDKDVVINKQTRKVFGRSLAVNKNLAKGSIIEINHLESKKPGGLGIPPRCYEQVLGKTLLHDLKMNNYLNWSDLND